MRFLTALIFVFVFTGVAFAGDQTVGLRGMAASVQSPTRLTLDNGEHVILAGIDIPSNKNISKEALDFVKMKTRSVPLVIEPVGLSGGTVYGHVFVGGESLQEMLISRGYAKVSTKRPTPVKANTWLQIQSDAIYRHAGIWGEPEKPQKRNNNTKNKKNNKK